MKTIEQVRASAAALVEKAEREHAVAMAQPESVRDRIEFVYIDKLSPTPRLHYKATDAADAVAILRAYGEPLDVAKAWRQWLRQRMPGAVPGALRERQATVVG